MSGQGAAAALIVNPYSGGQNRQGLELARALADEPRTRVVVLDDFAALEPALQEMARQPPEALFLSSGDGTIQYVQTWLAERSGLPRQRWPLLALLPHGSTNMTAADIGLKVRGIQRQAQLLRARGWRHDRARIITRPTVRVANTRQGVQHGMFIGAGVLAEATLYCRDVFNRGKGIRGQWGPLLTMLKVGGQALLKPAGPEDTQRVDRPHEMRVLADGELMGEGWQLAVLATTLRRLVLGARPFWGGCAHEDGAVMRVSLFGWPAPFLPRWLPVVLYGGERRRVHERMKSRCARRLEVMTNSRFAMDGEEILPREGEPLIIEQGPDMRYLTSA